MLIRPQVAVYCSSTVVSSLSPPTTPGPPVLVLPCEYHPLGYRVLYEHATIGPRELLDLYADKVAEDASLSMESSPECHDTRCRAAIRLHSLHVSATLFVETRSWADYTYAVVTTAPVPETSHQDFFSFVSRLDVVLPLVRADERGRK